MSKVGVIMD